MARAQNAYKGRFNKAAISVGSSTATITSNATGIVLAGGIRLNSKSTATVTGNATGIVVAGGVRFSNKANAVVTGNATGIVTGAAIYVAGKKYINANSTGFIFTAAATAPTARSNAKWAFYTNSTGQNGLLINTTGTTWKFAMMTSTLNGTSGY